MKEEFKLRFDQLSKIKETQSAKIGRGMDFEKLINDVFDNEGILLKRSYHTSDNKAEQIDGAIELLNRIILFEVKWVESGLAASDLYAFIGKIENKLIGTLGLFISKEELSENFVNSLSKGRRRNILLLHGKDIQLLFSGDLFLKDYLSYCIRRYSFDNIVHYDASSFLQSQKKVAELYKLETEVPSFNTENIRNSLRILITDERVEEYIIDLELQKLTPDEKVYLAKYLLEKYPKYYDASMSTLFSKKNRNQFSNMRYALSELVIQKDVLNPIVEIYFALYCASANERYLEDFLWESFRKGYETLGNSNKFQNALYENFKRIKGDYDKENMLTKVIEEIWPSIDEELQKKFLWKYLEIFFSGRKDKYDQKRFARALITSKKYIPIIKEWIETRIKEEFENTELSVDDIPNEAKYFARYYNELMTAIDLDETTWHKYITELCEAHLKE